MLRAFGFDFGCASRPCSRRARRAAGVTGISSAVSPSSALLHDPARRGGLSLIRDRLLVSLSLFSWRSVYFRALFVGFVRCRFIRFAFLALCLAVRFRGSRSRRPRRPSRLRCLRILASTPAAGAGSSIEALSVSSSTTFSSCATASPSRFEPAADLHFADRLADFGNLQFNAHSSILKARVINSSCSRWWAAVEPVAGLADGVRATKENG